MTDLKREYVIPLRRKTKFAPKWRRSKKAVSVLKEFIRKHMKTETVVLCNELNEAIWANGIKNPPGKVKVVALKMQLQNTEKTIVNLSEFGLDKQLELYKNEKVKVKKSKKESKKEDKKESKKEDKSDKVKDVEATEVESNEKNEEVKKVAPVSKKIEEKKLEVESPKVEPPKVEPKQKKESEVKKDE